jgi:hypothetical protein
VLPFASAKRARYQLSTINHNLNGMKDQETVQKFIELRAQGWSFVRIAAELGVAKSTLTEWSYKDDSATRHIGPMGQDFYSLFNIGTDEKHIAPIDEGGVALAAIQGLNAKLEEARQENVSLKARLDALEEIVRNPKSN